MGCGAARGQKGQEVEISVTKPVEESDTWATKTSAPSTKEVPSSTTEVEAFGAPKGDSSASSKTEQSAVILSDADEDDGGVEIICDSRPNLQAQQQPAEANGQEPPDFDEEPRRAEPKPLPKQQQEEAAKLAETRKRFEAKRAATNEQLTGQQTSKGGAFQADMAMPGFIDTGSEALDRPIEIAGAVKDPAARGERIDSLPKSNSPDFLLGLNVAEFTTKENADPFGCVPGSIFDELENLQQPMHDLKNRENQHDEVKSTGFDDEDEQMMKEIMDNFDA